MGYPNFRLQEDFTVCRFLCVHNPWGPYSPSLNPKTHHLCSTAPCAQNASRLFLFLARAFLLLAHGSSGYLWSLPTCHAQQLLQVFMGTPNSQVCCLLVATFILYSKVAIGLELHFFVEKIISLSLSPPPTPCPSPFPYF